MRIKNGIIVANYIFYGRWMDDREHITDIEQNFKEKDAAGILKDQKDAYIKSSIHLQKSRA